MCLWRQGLARPWLSSKVSKSAMSWCLKESTSFESSKGHLWRKIHLWRVYSTLRGDRSYCRYNQSQFTEVIIYSGSQVLSRSRSTTYSGDFTLKYESSSSEFSKSSTAHTVQGWTECWCMLSRDDQQRWWWLAAKIDQHWWTVLTSWRSSDQWIICSSDVQLKMSRDSWAAVSSGTEELMGWAEKMSSLDVSEISCETQVYCL